MTLQRLSGFYGVRRAEVSVGSQGRVPRGAPIIISTFEEQHQFCFISSEQMTESIRQLHPSRSSQGPHPKLQNLKSFPWGK
jgi:hypothetical protein